MFKGIDISMHNGAVDFNALKNGGINTVIIKATEGVDYIDPYLERHYKGANAHGLNIGFYHFMSEKTSPTQQARDFWKAIKDKNFNILPCLDIETNNMGRSRTGISDRCVEFLNEFKNISGLDCMIYTGGYFGRDNLDNRVKKYPGWIAHYGVNKPMETGFEVVGHQYTEDGRTAGVNTRVDMNNFTDGIFIKGSKPIAPSKPSSSPSKLWEKSISGEEVKSLQREINKQGFGNVKVDGYFGDDTLNACPMLKQGARGNITKLVQQRMLNRGYTSLKAHGGADGIFGSGMTQAVKNLQRNKGLSADGIIGKDTWKALYSK